ncbi:MAG: hypothetical protein MJB12_15005 [Firmicutes bacterium]|nr:hypothetical protein [Bacillota bacterium]
MFNRVASIQKAIADKSIEENTLKLMIDFYSAKGKLVQADYDNLMSMLEPAAPPEPTQ